MVDAISQGSKLFVPTVLATAVLASLAIAAAGSMHSPRNQVISNDRLGQAIFENKCKVCHDQFGQPTGAGARLGAPDLRSPAVQRLSDSQIANQIVHGKTNMPGFKGALKPADVNELVRYIRILGKNKVWR
jgi:mono/diheme cytochrome c family protein